MATTAVRGVRGATTAEANTAEAILAAASELVKALVEANGIRPEQVASAMFTTTADLDAEYPARAIRGDGWEHVALLGGQEMAKPSGVARCIRVLIHWNTSLPAMDVRHVYLRGAVALRPDRVDPGRGAPR